MPRSNEIATEIKRQCETLGVPANIEDFEVDIMETLGPRGLETLVRLDEQRILDNDRVVECLNRITTITNYLRSAGESGKGGSMRLQ